MTQSTRLTRPPTARLPARAAALAGLLGTWTLLAAPAAHAQTETPPLSAPAVVDTMEAVFGSNVGVRRNHTKGLCAEGRFTAGAEALRYSRSPLFAGAAVPVQARFSLAGGRGGAPDAARNPRGLALQFQLPGSVLHQMALLNVPVFSAATPEAFFARLDADRPDPATGKPDAARQKAVAEKYTDNKPLGAWLSQHRPPPSYGNTTYHSLHAFEFTNAQHQSRWVKWRFVPRDGDLELSDEQLKAAPPSFLAAALTERLAKGPVEWDLVLTLAESGDPLDNPTLAWPAGRSEVKVGTLAIERAGGTACEAINFDPLVLSDGVAPSADPVLAFRSGAYAMSWVRRQGEAVKK